MFIRSVFSMRSMQFDMILWELRDLAQFSTDYVKGFFLIGLEKLRDFHNNNSELTVYLSSSTSIILWHNLIKSSLI